MEGEAMKLLYYSLSQVIAVIQAVAVPDNAFGISRKAISTGTAGKDLTLLL